MRILITGGAGCLGSNLVESWLSKGHDILVIDNFATGRREVVPTGVERLRVVEGSIADRELVDRTFDGFKPSHVVHAAAAYRSRKLARGCAPMCAALFTSSKRARANVRRFINFLIAPVMGVRGADPRRSSVSAGELRDLRRSAGLRGANCRPVAAARESSTRFAIWQPTFYTRLKLASPCSAAARA